MAEHDESGHTPGPWRPGSGGTRGAWIEGANGEWTALACGNTDKRAAHNAQLIAAAPELLSALGGLLHAVCGEAGFANAVRMDSHRAYPWPALDEAEAKARAVIAKATA